MNKSRKIWDFVSSPVFMRRFNGWAAIFWVVMIPISMWAGWLDSVVYVSALSIWALVASHWSTWQSARVEIKQDDQVKQNKQEEESS